MVLKHKGRLVSGLPHTVGGSVPSSLLEDWLATPNNGTGPFLKSIECDSHPGSPIQVPGQPADNRL